MQSADREYLEPQKTKIKRKRNQTKQKPYKTLAYLPFLTFCGVRHI